MCIPRKLRPITEMSVWLLREIFAVGLDCEYFSVTPKGGGQEGQCPGSWSVTNEGHWVRSQLSVNFLYHTCVGSSYICVSRRRRKMYCGHARLRVCLSAAVRPHYCMDPDVTWGRGRGCPLVVHYWADLQSVHRLRCYGNITRTLVYAGCARVAD